MSSVNKTVYSKNEIFFVPCSDTFHYAVEHFKIPNEEKLLWWLDWLKIKSWVTDLQLKQFEALVRKHLNL